MKKNVNNIHEMYTLSINMLKIKNVNRKNL